VTLDGVRRDRRDPDLLAWRDARLERAELFYRRTTIGEEVDLVIEAGGRLLPIEVKASGRPRLGDVKHLRTFRAEYGGKARSGILLHTGKTLEWIAPGELAVPRWNRRSDGRSSGHG